MSQSIEREKQFRQESELARRSKHKCRMCRNELEFLDLKRQLRFFLSLFAAGDLFAKLARMRAAECFRNCFCDG